MVDDAGGPAAAGNPRRRREGRHPHARRAGGIRRHRARPRQRGADLRADRRGDRARRFRPRRQAGAELEGVGAAAQPGAAPSAGALVPAHCRRPAIPAGPLPDRAARRLRPLAALQRAGSRDADPRGEAERRMGHQRPQAIHLQRLRRRPVCGLRQHQSAGRHDAGHVELSGAARHAGAHHRALQRDHRLPLHEQRRTGVRGHAGAGRSSSGRGRRAGQGRASISGPARSSRRRRISASACAPSRSPPTTRRTTCRAAAS